MLISKPKEKFSVVMSIYKLDNPKWVTQSIGSILNQSRPANEIIIVIDGPISLALQQCLDAYGEAITKIPLRKNAGLWNALNVGIAAARYDLIARMDADDVSIKDRFEKQVTEFEQDNELSLLGGQLVEFTDSIEELGAQREVPIDYDEIVRFAKYRSPFNHPTVMFRKTSVQAVGGYHELYRTEDYDLWVRMIQAGMKMKNLQDIVLYYRTTEDNQLRKSSPLQRRESINFYKTAYAQGFISYPEYAIATAAKRLFYMVPYALQSLLYHKLLRKK